MKRQKVIELDCVDSKKLDIDWENVLAEEEVPELEIIGSNKTPVTCSGEDSAAPVQSLDDSQIDVELNRRRSSLSSLSVRLPDNGEKIRTRIGNLEYEKQRRLLHRTKVVCLFNRFSFLWRVIIGKDCEVIVVTQNESFWNLPVCVLLFVFVRVLLVFFYIVLLKLNLCSGIRV